MSTKTDLKVIPSRVALRVRNGETSRGSEPATLQAVEWWGGGDDDKLEKKRW
jgi:hypothetical protein